MRFGGIVLVSVLLLGACSGPELKEPKHPTSSATPTPSATVPTMPPQAAEDSPEGAAAFVKHYIDVFNYASNTGDVAELSKLSSPDCDGCQSYIKLYRDTYAAGGYFRGGWWEVGDLEVEQSATDYRIFGHVTAAVGTQATSSDSSSAPTAPEDSDIIFRVSRSSDRPVIFRLTRAGK